MVRIFQLTLVAFFSLVLATSCMSDKKIIYLQGADTIYAVPQGIAQAFELTIEPDDELAISVSSKNSELIAPFNTNTLIGSGTGASQTIFSLIRMVILSSLSLVQ